MKRPSALRRLVAISVPILALSTASGCGGGGGGDAAPVAVLKGSMTSATMLLLDGGLSTASGERRITRYEWRLDGAPAASTYSREIGAIVTTDATGSSLQIPVDASGEYRYSLRVFDGSGYSGWVTLAMAVTLPAAQ